MGMVKSWQCAERVASCVQWETVVNYDNVIDEALRITALDLLEDTNGRMGAEFAAIAADMADMIPCDEDDFRDELDRRYGLSRHELDDDLDMHHRIFDALVTDDPSRRNAPFLWVCDESTSPWTVTIEHAP